jgi:hypothetical protein
MRGGFEVTLSYRNFLNIRNSSLEKTRCPSFLKFNYFEIRKGSKPFLFFFRNNRKVTVRLNLFVLLSAFVANLIKRTRSFVSFLLILFSKVYKLQSVFIIAIILSAILLLASLLLNGSVLVNRFKPSNIMRCSSPVSKSIDGFFTCFVHFIYRIVQVTRIYLCCTAAASPCLSAHFITRSKALSASKVSMAISAMFINISCSLLRFIINFCTAAPATIKWLSSYSQ